MKQISKKLFSGLLFCFCAAMLYPQENSPLRLVVVPLRNETGNIRFDPVCRSVSDTVDLTIRLSGRYSVNDQETAKLLSLTEFLDTGALATFANQQSVDEIIYGRGALNIEGAFFFQLSLFSREKNAVTHDLTIAADSIFDVSQAADKLIVDFLSDLSGSNVQFGSVEITKIAGNGAYSAFLDDVRITNLQTNKRVLVGDYTLSIHQARLQGNTVLFSEPLSIRQDKTETIKFTIPGATEEDFRLLAAQRKELSDLAKANNTDKMLLRLANFQNNISTIDYDDNLRTQAFDIIQETGKKATLLLSEEEARADELFYQKKPDFVGALDRYTTLSSMLNDVYRYQTIESTPELPISFPTKIVFAPNDTLYLFDGHEYQKILAKHKSGEPIGQIDLSERDTGRYATIPDIEVDFASRLYHFDPKDPFVSMYDADLKLDQLIIVPDYKTIEKGFGLLAVSSDALLFVYVAGNMYVMSSEGHKQAGREETFRSHLEEMAPLDATEMFFDHRELLNLYSFTQNRLIRFDPMGNFHSVVDMPFGNQGAHIAVDTSGFIYLTDPVEHRIHKFTSQGEFLTSIGTYGADAGEFSGPVDVEVTPDNSIYVSDAFNGRIQRLDLLSPPIVFPEIARLGKRFAERKSATLLALEKLELIREQNKPIQPLAELSAGLLLLGGSAVLGYFAQDLQNTVSELYLDYQAATEPAAAGLLRDEITSNWTLSRAAFAGALASVGAGVSLLTAGILTAADYGSAKKSAIDQIQSFEMDTLYELDIGKYKDLRTAQTVGLFTGIAPPLLLGSTALAFMYFGFDVEKPEETALLFTIGAVAVPPIWSHLFAGKLHIGLLTSSILADAAAIGAYLIQRLRPEDWEPSDIVVDDTSGDLYAAVNDTWKFLQSAAAQYLMLGALGIRIAAGIYDATMGWRQANTYNRNSIWNPAAEGIVFSLKPAFIADSVGIGVNIRL